MSCSDCKIDYLLDKTAVLDGCVRRMSNHMGYSPNSAQVSDVQAKNAYEIREFEKRWSRKVECTHGNTESEFTPEPGKEKVRDQVGNIGVDSLTTGRTKNIGTGSGGSGKRGKR